jgi:hypothetical protein
MAVPGGFTELQPQPGGAVPWPVAAGLAPRAVTW